MPQRHVKFDKQELVRIATEATGSYVVAKIYTPKAGRPHYVTASEVATMEFVRINHPLFGDGVNSHRPVTF